MPGTVPGRIVPILLRRSGIRLSGFPSYVSACLPAGTQMRGSRNSYICAARALPHENHFHLGVQMVSGSGFSLPSGSLRELEVRIQGQRLRGRWLRRAGLGWSGARIVLGANHCGERERGLRLAGSLLFAFLFYTLLPRDCVQRSADFVVVSVSAVSKKRDDIIA